MTSDNNKMTKEAFKNLVDNVESQARGNVKSAALVADHSNRALDRMAEHDPQLVALLKQGIASRGECSQRVLDYIASRREARDGKA